MLSATSWLSRFSAISSAALPCALVAVGFGDSINGESNLRSDRIMA